MSGAHPFTTEHYRSILETAQKAGYEFRLFDQSPAQQTIHLRHDIDNDIAVALDMAKLEATLGIKSTYLVLIRSANYNALERNNAQMLGEMMALGHEVGLHFSLVDHPQRDASVDELPALIRADADLLSGILGRPVSVFGFHNPEKKEQYKVEVPGLTNAYNDAFTDQVFYYSESNMQWREGCPCILLSEKRYDRFQLLVHPLSFFADLKSDRDVVLQFLSIRMKDLLEYNVSQNRVLQKQGLGLPDAIEFLRSEANS